MRTLFLLTLTVLFIGCSKEEETVEPKKLYLDTEFYKGMTETEYIQTTFELYYNKDILNKPNHNSPAGIFVVADANFFVGGNEFTVCLNYTVKSGKIETVKAMVARYSYGTDLYVFIEDMKGVNPMVLKVAAESVMRGLGYDWEFVITEGTIEKDMLQ